VRSCYASHWNFIRNYRRRHGCALLLVATSVLLAFAPISTGRQGKQRRDHKTAVKEAPQSEMTTTCDEPITLGDLLQWVALIALIIIAWIWPEQK
jgi:hypothetical protein